MSNEQDDEGDVPLGDHGLGSFKSIGEAAGIAVSAMYAAWLTESPIEGLMATALTPRILAAGGLVLFKCEIIAGTKIDDDQLRLILQSQIAEYRVDFELFRYLNGRKRSLIIECDGFDFHERTVQQATSDRRRDRYFLRTGVPTLRFTGWELTKDARACAEEVVAYWTSFYDPIWTPG